MAREREVFGIIAAPVLPGDDVFDMESVERLIVLMDAAILAPLSGPVPHKVSQRVIHRLG